MEYPDYFARFYDIIYHQIRSETDTDFFLNQISKANGPVLEIGTGTGRFFTKALEQGADIYGIDVSKSMIDVLKAKINKKFHSRVSVQNIIDFQLDKTFKLIIAPFRVFMHLLTTKEQLDALNNVHKHLDKDGLFIFDLFVPNLEIIKNGLNEVIDFSGEYEPGKRIQRVTSAKSDLMTQINNITMKFIWDEDSGQQTKEWNFRMRYFFRYELEYLVQMSKLKLLKICGDYDENELSVDSKDFVIYCKKSSN